MEIRKVHLELNDVNRETSYDLGYFSIQFEDGEVTFRLYATICATHGCPCDNLKCDWFAGDEPKTTWYTADGQWLDEHQKPLPDEVQQVFRIAEQTEEFQERYLHLMYLRRRMVLRELNFEESGAFEVPKALLLRGAAPEQGSLGSIRSGGESWQLDTGFCGDPECYCYDVFLNLSPADSANPVCVRVDLEGRHDLVAPPADQAGGREQSVAKAVAKEPGLKGLLDFMRQRRRLENYARFTRKYEDKHMLFF
ncbi:hypothetical protein [Acanthopleuribacter pedis]|uniref:Uncharacterized protein n=1 Tax=Acanthopleuribacter pedis TaxID=442870 RepID=A0A8J7U695_9BACT|nr:hypothetical protein [Acanthopleuribacter pedis]MBO1320136.1 hypothetical protein [Acanthopleuribacter pedis]